jgi:amino acid transporter
MSSPARFRREVGTFALMLTGLGSIIGSGWLFGAWRAAAISGTGAIWAWVLGAAIIITVALTYAELGALFPESGGMVRYGHYSHGSLVGFIAAWSNWIAIVSVIPVEAEASVQYMASWPYAWAQNLYVHSELTSSGLAIAAGLVIVYFLLNFWSVRLFAHSNAAITVFKLVVPASTGLVLIASGFHYQNFSVHLQGDPHTIDFAAVLTAVATAGIVFSFNGFQSPVNLAGEAREPARSIPIAVLGSIVLAGVIYVILQVAYLGAVPPSLLSNGWQGINFRSPFAELALLLNLNWLAVLLYADAFISPSGTGITYTATTARMLYGMQRNGTLPAAFGQLHARWGIPRNAMWFNLLVAFLFLFEFRGWGTLAAVISVATIISYLTGPVSAVTLRRTAAALHRPFRVPALRVVAALAFIFSTELLYWAKWPLTGQIILLVAVALPVYAYYQARAAWNDFGRQLRGAWWVIVYMPTIACVSWAGSAKFGGHGYLTWGWDLVVVAVLGLVFFIWGARSGWTTPSVEQARAENEQQV